MYNYKNIRAHKGKLVMMTYKNYIGYRDQLTGEITATTKYRIIFNVNRAGHEISLKYSQIIIIDPIKNYKKISI